VESVLAHHARLLAAHGHAVQIIAGRGEAWDDRLPLALVPLADSRHPDILAAKKELDAGRAPPEFAALVDSLAPALRPFLAGVDVLIAHNVCSLHKNLALTAALHQLHSESPAPRFILWHHDLAWTAPRYRAELHAGYPWDLLRTDWAGVRHVAVSDFRRAELAALLRIPPARITVVPNGVEVEGLLKLEARTVELIRALRLSEAEPLLLLPVRLTPRKNIELALRTLAALRRTLPDARLLVTGPAGPHNPANAEYQQRLLALRDELGLRGAAYFVAEQATEFLPDAVVADFFRLADALLLPSREEGFGLPLLEAALARLPVFCADIPPLRDLGGAEAAYFSPDADAEMVAALITARLQSDAAYRFAARARRSYAWENVYAQYLAPLLRG